MQEEHRHGELVDVLVESIEGHHLGFQKRALVAAVVDQRILGVASHGLGIPRHPRRIARLLRQLRERQDFPGPVPLADHRPEETHRRHLVRIALGEAGGEEPAHGVADDDEGQTGILGPGNLAESVQVIDHVLEVTDERPLSVAASVTDMIRCVDHRAVCGEPLRHVRIAPAVLGVAVDEHHDATCRPLWVPPAVEHVSFASLERCLDHLRLHGGSITRDFSN